MSSVKKCFESITLTHIINPHMFWFRPESAYCSNEKYWALEESLDEHFPDTKITGSNRIQFAVGEMAAVYMESWGKWIRVIVDKNIKMMHGKIKCVLWAVDWGFPLQTDLERIRKLPSECAAFEAQDLYFAGLNYIVPSETRLDLTLLKSVEIQSHDWSELVVQEFRKLIEQASNIKFIPEIEKSEGRHTFGRLEITTHKGIIIDANDVLLQISGVKEIKNSTQFLLALKNSNTTKIQRSYSNYNRLSFADLNYDKVASETLDMEYKLNNDLFHTQAASVVARPSRIIVDKVIEWDRRNYEVNSVVGQSECESDIGTLVLEDEAFESISCYAEQDLHNTNQPCNRNYYEDDEDECFVNLCDLVRQNIRATYQGGMPRPATFPDELAQKEENFEAGPYNQKMIDKRKRLIELEKTDILTTSSRSNESDVESTTTSQLSYLDKLNEKRARALKNIQEKNAANRDIIKPNEPVNSIITAESEYDKDEQKRREQIKLSIRGTDRTIGIYPVEYTGMQINKIKANKIQQPSANNERRQVTSPNGQSNYHQRQNENQCSNKQSPQQRLYKYNTSNINSNTNGGFPEPSEAESDVW